jgi:hypothetical protein
MTKDEAVHSSTRTIRVSSADIHVTEWGAGLPVLMLHGNPDSGIVWDGIAERLATHFRCIAPDLPGFGHSEVPAGFERSLDGLAEFIQQFLSAVAPSISWRTISAARLLSPGQLNIPMQCAAWLPSTRYSSAIIAGTSGRVFGARRSSANCLC